MHGDGGGEGKREKRGFVCSSPPGESNGGEKIIHFWRYVVHGTLSMVNLEERGVVGALEPWEPLTWSGCLRPVLFAGCLFYCSPQYPLAHEVLVCGLKDLRNRQSQSDGARGLGSNGFPCSG